MPWSSFDAGLETRAGFRPRGDRVTGNRVARGPWCARTRAPPGGGRVARGRAVGKRQGHPWTDGRSGTGSRVDGRSKTGSPADVPGSPVDGRTDGRTDGRGQGRPSDAPCLQTAPPPPLCRLTSPRPDGSRGHRWYRRLCQARGFEKPITLEWRGLEGGSAMVGAVGNSAAHTKSVTQPALFRPPAAARRTAAHASSEGI